MHKRFGILLSLWLITFSAYAQYNQTQLYTVADGLPMTESNGVFCDQEGYLWIVGNNLQICHFDGRKFENFPVSLTGIDFANYSTRITQDSLGIWFYAFTQEDQGKIIRYQAGQWKKYIDTHISTFFYYPDWGTMAGINFKGELFQFNHKSDAWEVMDSMPLSMTIPSWVTRILISKFVLGDGYSLRFQDFTGSKIDTYWMPNLQSSFQFKINFDNDPAINHYNYWLDHAQPFSNSFRLQIIKNKHRENLNFITPGGRSLPLYTQRLSTINGIKTAIALDTGVSDSYYLVQFGSDSLFHAIARFKQSSADLDVTQDLQGHFWIASHTGVIRVNPYVLQCLEDQSNIVRGLQLITQDDQGSIWFGAYRDGLERFDGDHLLRDSPENLLRIMPGGYHDPENGMFCFEECLGLVHYQNDHWFWSGRKTPSINSCFGPPCNTGYYITPVSGSQLAMGVNRDGLALTDLPYRPNNDTKIISKDKGMLLDNVLTITEDRNQRLWLGRSSQGIAVYDPVQDTATSWLRQDTTKHAFGVMSSCLDDRGNLWLGCHDGIRFLEAPHQINLFSDEVLQKTKKLELPEAGTTLVPIIKQVKDYIVFANNTGHGIIDLASFYRDAQSPRVFFYDTRDARLGAGGEQNAIHIDTAGRVWIGKDFGAIRIVLDHLIADTLPVSVLIDSLIAGDEMVVYDDLGHIRLPLSKRNVRVWYHPSFTGYLNDNVYYRYRIRNKNGEDQYSPNTRETYLNFQYLPPGTNQLEIQAIKNNQVVDTQVLTMRVPYTLSETPWFWGLLVTGVLAFTLVWYRQKLALNREKLEASEARREKEQFQIRAIANSLNPHFINNSLSWIQLRMRGDEEGIKVVGRLAENIKSIFVKSRDGKAFHTIAEEMELVANYIEIQQARFSNQFKVQLPNDHELAPSAGLQVPLMQIQIHVENAIEHGLRDSNHGHQLEVKLQDKDPYLLITVTDTGIGRVASAAKGRYGTKQGTLLLNNLQAIFNRVNKLQITTHYEDLPFNDPLTNEKYGTSVSILIPKTYRYELE